MKRTLACLLAVFLSGGPTLAESKASGKAIVGETPVSWMTMNSKMARSAGVKRPLSLILFSFDAKTRSATVSDAKWAAEAARHGVDVNTLKMVLGRSVYVNQHGQLASCTMSAIESGFCGKHSSLAVERRAEIAKSILEHSGECHWTGFDAELHSRLAQRNGAASATLWVAADCR